MKIVTEAGDSEDLKRGQIVSPKTVKRRKLKTEEKEMKSG